MSEFDFTETETPSGVIGITQDANTDLTILPLETISVPVSGHKEILCSLSADTGHVEAMLVKQDDSVEKLRVENTPQEFGVIKTFETLGNFLKDSWAKVTSLSDGSHKLYVSQKLPGGSGKSSSSYETKITGGCIKFGNSSGSIGFCPKVNVSNKGVKLQGGSIKFEKKM